jgi:2-methylaconitate cis-trans-isomerase PrpF
MSPKVSKIAMALPRKEPTNGEINIRSMSVGQARKAILVIAALAIAATAKILGSIIANCLHSNENEEGLEIYYASSKLQVNAIFNNTG